VVVRAAVIHRGVVSLREVPEPVSVDPYVVARPLVSGVCGSDVAVLDHGEELWALRREVDELAPHGPLRGASVDPFRAFVPGHEFCAEVLDPGKRSDLAPGDRVVSVPRIVDPEGRKHTVGFSSVFPGALGERMLLDPKFALRVPDRLEPRHAALIEPLAVAGHAVRRSGIQLGTAAVVVGCGPVGLCIIVRLVADGLGPVVASDPVAARRGLARAVGANVVVDPAETTPMTAWARHCGGHPPVVFEAAGKPGVLDRVLLDAVAEGEIIVVGACMGADTIRPMLGLGREITIRFSLGYTTEEFAATLHDMAAGRLRAEALIGETVSLDEVPAAFDRMRSRPPAGKLVVAVTP